MIKDALCDALSANNITEATRLIKAGKTNGVDRSFNTPLHIALEKEMNSDFIKLMLETGNFHLRNRNMHNKRALDVANDVFARSGDENSRRNAELLERAYHKEFNT